MPAHEDLPHARSERIAYLHIGLPKTGTSYLQNVFWHSAEALAEQDFVMLPKRRPDHLRVALAVRNMFQEFDDDWVRGALGRLSARAAQIERGTVLVSQEAFAPTRPEHARRLLDAIGDYEFHLVVTARDPARQIPSAWQQRVQGRATFTYEEFVAAVLAREPLASDFWANQDLVDVLIRWSQLIPPERIHVITCPPPGSDRGLLLARFCSVVGVDPAVLNTETSQANAALGQPQAELMRRVNVALGDRLPHIRSGYRRVGQVFLSDRILRPQGGRQAKLPRETRAPLDALVDEWTRFLLDGGFDVVGDVAELRPSPASFTDVPVTITDAELVDVAATAIADILARRHDEQDERDQHLKRIEELEDQLRYARSTRGSARNLARRLVRGT